MAELRRRDRLRWKALQAERSLIVDVLSRIKERELASFDWLKTHAPDLLDERWQPHCGRSRPRSRISKLSSTSTGPDHAAVASERALGSGVQHHCRGLQGKACRSE